MVYSEVEHMLQAMGRLRAVSEIPVILCGMRKSEFAALAVLDEHAAECSERGSPGLTTSQLSRELGISPAGVSQMLNTLVSKSLVERVPDAHDRRVVRILLTEQGARTAACAKEQLCSLAERILREMGPDDAHRLLKLLDKASAVINSELAALRTRLDAENVQHGKEPTCENTSGT